MKNLYKKLRSYKGLLVWYLKGKPSPPPHLIKQRTVKSFKANIFIETGTLFGDMIQAVKRKYNRIYSIEVDRELWAKANKRFKQKHITIYRDDSAKKLPELLHGIYEKCVFWLDGHTSTSTPILKELEAIKKHRIKDHIILIDDARLFDGKNYPTVEKVRSYFPDKKFKIENDIIIFQ